MPAKFKPYQTTSVDAFIELGKELDISESTIAFKSKIDDKVIIPYHNVITKFYRAINEHIVDLEMTEEEHLMYYQQPKLFCYQAYGTPELAYSLLYINDMPSAMDFKKKKIKAFSDDIITIINELMSLNEEDLTENHLALED